VVDSLTPDIVDKIKLMPSFCFIDPYGFKGVTIKLVRSAIKDWGCECMIFFNTSDINRNLELGQSEAHLRMIFGTDNYNRLLKKISSYPMKREEYILSVFHEACKDAGAKFLLKFQINCLKGQKYHLIYLTKHRLGFNKMKKVMAKYSRSVDGGIPLYLYAEGYKTAGDQQSLDLYLTMSMAKLKHLLLQTFAGRKITVKRIIKTCDENGLLYTERNIKDALDHLEIDGVIKDLTPGKRKRQKGTFGENRIVKFPAE
jgi:hypothetical protein